MNRETNATLASTATKGTIETNIRSVNTFHSASTGLTGRTTPSDRWMAQSREALISREENQVKNPIQKVFSLVENAKRERKLKRKKKKNKFILGTVLFLGAVLVAVILTGTVSFEDGFAFGSDNKDNSDDTITDEPEDPNQPDTEDNSSTESPGGPGSGANNSTENPGETISSGVPTAAPIPLIQEASKAPSPSSTLGPNGNPILLTEEDLDLIADVCNAIPGAFPEDFSDGSFSVCLSESHQVTCEILSDDSDSDSDSEANFFNNDECDVSALCNCKIGQIVDTSGVGRDGCEVDECIPFNEDIIAILRNLIDEINNSENDGILSSSSSSSSSE